jgi:hypothetical protein
VDIDNGFIASSEQTISYCIWCFRKYRSAETMGTFSLLGKFINVSDINNQKLIQNKEAVGLMGSIG